MKTLTIRSVLPGLTTMMMSVAVCAQDSVEWFTLGNDYAHTRFTPSDEINASNFGDLEVAWEWDGASFGAVSGRSTPSYIDGKLFTVAGYNRHVIAIDPKTGELAIDNIESETTLVMENLKAILEAANMTFKNVIKSRKVILKILKNLK